MCAHVTLRLNLHRDMWSSMKEEAATMWQVKAKARMVRTPLNTHTHTLTHSYRTTEMQREIERKRKREIERESGREIESVVERHRDGKQEREKTRESERVRCKKRQREIESKPVPR